MEYLRSIVGGAEIQVVRGDYDEVCSLKIALYLTRATPTAASRPPVIVDGNTLKQLPANRFNTRPPIASSGLTRRSLRDCASNGC